MSYLVLARKLRPSRFKDIVGQGHIWKTLINAIETDRVAHAFLFTGPRGTGKTSCARILTKALNCMTPVNYEPCNTCENCVEINKGISTDVMEIDAASNRGIEHIRELRDGVKFSPAKCRYKTYIIDEVHMLTTESFNALLKTLEEPPSHVKFILATTDPHKIPTTVISRCQRYDFTNISIPAMVEHLKWVAEKEGIKISSQALRIIAGNSAGGMRDALTTMDMLISFSGMEISDQNVVDILGVNDYKEVDELLSAIVNKDLGGALSLFQNLINKGRSLAQFVTDLMKSIKDLSLVKSLSSNQLQWHNFLPDQQQMYAKLATQTTVGTLQQYFNILLEVEIQIKRSSQAKVCIEMGIIKLCSVESLAGVGEFIAALRDSKFSSKRALAPSLSMIGHVSQQKPAIPTVSPATEPKVETEQKVAEPKVEAEQTAAEPKVEAEQTIAEPKVEAEQTVAEPKVEALAINVNKLEPTLDEGKSTVPPTPNSSQPQKQMDVVISMDTDKGMEGKLTADKNRPETTSDDLIKNTKEPDSICENLKKEQTEEKKETIPYPDYQTPIDSPNIELNNSEEPPNFFEDVPALGDPISKKEDKNEVISSEGLRVLEDSPANAKKDEINFSPPQTSLESNTQNEAILDNDLENGTSHISDVTRSKTTVNSPNAENFSSTQKEERLEDNNVPFSEKQEIVKKWKNFVDLVAEHNNKSLVSLLRNAILLKLTDEVLEIGFNNLEVFNRDKKIEVADLARTFFNPNIKVFYKSRKNGIDDSLKSKDDAEVARKIENRIELAKENPNVKSVLENFPGSKIKKVTIIEELENDG